MRTAGRRIYIDSKPLSCASRPLGARRGGGVGDVYTVAYIMNLKFFRCGSQHYAETPNVLDLLQAFGQRAGRVVACAPTTVVDVPPTGAELIPPDVEICELPFYANNLDLVVRSPVLAVRLASAIWPKMRHWDIVGGDAPSGFGMAAAILAILRRKQAFFYVRGHLTRIFRTEQRDLTAKGALVIAAFWPLDIVARALTAAGVLTFAMGPQLARRHRGPRVHVLRGYARPGVVGTHAGPALADPMFLRRVAYVGRLSAEKGADVLLEALALLRDRGEEIFLTVTGDGPEMNSLRDLAHRLRIEDRVRFTGNIIDQTAVRERFLGAGIVVIPSRTEGVPVAMLEAMALGRAIIATRVGGTPSVLVDGENGLLIEADDAAGIAAAIMRLCHDPALAFRLAEAAGVTGRELNLNAQADVMMREAMKGLP